MQAKPYRGIGMNGPLATWYAAVSRHDISAFAALARRMAADLPGGGRVLDLAPGPGYFAIELAKLGPYRIAGLDISPSFVRIARRNAADAGVYVDFHQGNAAAMPFSVDEFDLVVCRAAFKNFAEPVAVLREIHRVLKPGGRAVVIDMRADISDEDIVSHVDLMKLGGINRFLTRQILVWLRKRAYAEADFRKFLEVCSFRHCDIETSATGFEILLLK